LSVSMEDDYVEEACYYLSRLDKSVEEIGKEFSMTTGQVEAAIENYRKKIESNEISYDEETKDFWAKINQESSGDEKITLVDDKGRYYHGWKSEIEKLDTAELVELLVVNKKYSDRHPLSEFSKTQPVVGYDPIVPLRNIRRTVLIIDNILQKREGETESAP
jgi:hypothetical protein